MAEGQFCDHPLEHCEDTRLHDAAYVGDLQTLRSLLQGRELPEVALVEALPGCRGAPGAFQLQGRESGD